MVTNRRRYVWLGLAALLLALAAMLPATADAEEGDEQNVHPAVDVYAELFPGESVPVIVQSEDPNLVRWVTDHGGTVTRQFDIVGGFEAEMPIEAVRALDFADGADWISLNAPMMTSDRPERGMDASHLTTVYPPAVGAPRAWRQGVTGDHVTIAVIDSGLNPGADFGGRIAGSRNFSSESYFPFDQNGHGTWVAGIIAGRDPRGRYLGIAPGADLLSVKVAGRDGSAHAGDVIEALQWVVRNKDRYDVGVINISLNSAIADSYLRDPLAAAVEEAWFQGIVVVVSAGNLGASPFAVDHAPANDPFVITVGSFDDRGTPARSDDVIADWSSRGVTVDGYAKPEVTAPGVGIVSVSGGNHTYLARQAPEAVVDGRFLRLSGSSASAAIVSGTVALMLDGDPSLTPDEVKYRAAAAGTPLAGSPAPAVDAAGAAFTNLEGAANGGALPNEFIDPETGMILRDSILWRSILWRSILWRNILWRNILWRG